MIRVAVIEEDLAVYQHLRLAEGSRQYEVVHASGAERGSVGAADLIVLVLSALQADPVGEVRALRRRTDAPVMIVHGGSTEEDRAAALDAGADDFVAYPIDAVECWARIRGILRRVSPSVAGAVPPELPIGRHLVSLYDRTVRLANSGHRVRISPTQWLVLEMLLRHPGRTVSTEDLLRNVWGDRHHGRRDYVRQYIVALRRRLEEDPSNPRHLVTDLGRGYRYQR